MDDPSPPYQQYNKGPGRNMMDEGKNEIVAEGWR